jgi:hypothetical protein
LVKVCRNGILVYYWCKCKLVHPFWKIIAAPQKKNENRIATDPAVPLLGIYPKT